MNRTPYDRLAKTTFTATLQGAGVVKTHVETISPAYYVDLVFEPDAAKLHALASWGWLGRIAATGPVLFEFFHNPPDVQKVRTCFIKHGLWLESHEKSNKAPPRLWLFSAGRPGSAITHFGFRRDRSWPSGVYNLKAGWPGAALVVVNELPVIRETLLLRLLGRDKVLAHALKELANLPGGSPELRVLNYNLVPVRLRRSANNQEELMSTIFERAEKWEKRLEKRAHRQGERKGQLELLKKLLKLKFPKAGAAALTRLDDATDKQLAKWSERVLFAESLNEVFR